MENWFTGEPARSAAVLLGSWTRCGTTLSSSGQEEVGGDRDRGEVFNASTVRRRLTEDRWNPEARELVTTVPWRMNEDDDKADGEQFAKL